MQRNDNWVVYTHFLWGTLLWATMVILLLVLAFLVACEGGKGAGWTPPEFVKEWEIKEIKPGARHRILSVTTTDTGVFVLVNATETVYLPPRRPKPVSEMTEKEKNNFIQKYATGKYLSGSAVNKLNKKERDEYISLIIRHFFPPRKASEMSEDEKQTIIAFLKELKLTKEEEANIASYKNILRDKTTDWHIDIISEGILKANEPKIISFW